MSYYIVPKDELYHYGVKGMKWGKHLKSMIGIAQKEKYKQEQQNTKDEINNRAYQQSKYLIDHYRKTGVGYNKDNPDFWEKDLNDQINTYLSHRSRINEQKVRESEAYKKYSKTPLGKIENAVNQSAESVSGFVKKIFGIKPTPKYNPAGSLKDRIQNSVKRNVYIASYKKQERDAATSNKGEGSNKYYKKKG